MNKRDQAILDWVQRNRPDVFEHFQKFFQGVRRASNDSQLSLMAIGFEAGRQFQSNNQDLELDDPSVYL